MPVSQKYAASCGTPSRAVTAASRNANGAVAAGLQHRQHRNDGDENAGEQNRDLADRLPGEAVGGAMFVGRQAKR